MEDTNTNKLDSENLENGIKIGKEQSRTKKGFSLVGFGAIILLSGCMVTLVLPISHPLYNFLLYGPTSVGACMVIFGLYNILE